MDISALQEWVAAFPNIIAERRTEDLKRGLVCAHRLLYILLYSPLFHQRYISELTRNGYRGYLSPWVLSAHAELVANQGRFEHFNWGRVSPSDPRIFGSEWLNPADRKSFHKIFLQSTHLLPIRRRLPAF
jgi:hypothetical protein